MVNTAKIRGLWTPRGCLRIGLAGVFLYVGFGAIFDPKTWLGYVPEWVGGLVPREIFLGAHGIFEIALGATLLLGIMPRFASLAAFLSLAAILVFYGVDAATFRDFGLMMMAAALYKLEKEDRASP